MDLVDSRCLVWFDALRAVLISSVEKSPERSRCQYWGTAGVSHLHGDLSTELASYRVRVELFRSVSYVYNIY